ncbi:MAG TPA: hypothetical protein VLK58_23160 [Conexibacter sp.]|nr:hypothetical protein [Conexibacter sp.]
MAHDAPPRADLAGGLRAWHDAIARGRRVAVVRRALLVALALAALLLLARVVVEEPPAWLVAALPLVLFAALCLRARRRLALAPVARLLDRRLGLAETVGTAWELAKRSAPAAGSLADRVVADGGRLVWSARERAQVRPRPARGEWTALAAAVAVLAALVAIGPSGGDPRDGAETTRADADDARAVRPDDPARRTTGATVTTPVAAAPPATSPLPTGARRPSTTPGQSGAPATAGRADAATRIAVRRQPTRAASGAAGAGGGRSGGTAAAGTGRSGAAGDAVGRREQTGSAAPAASLPPPSQVKEFSAQGRRATSPVASGSPAQATGAPTAGERGAARSGTRGAGRQAGRLGGEANGRSETGARRLPLRLLATSGGRQQGSGAGRAGTGGRGRGSARVQSGSTAGGDMASGPVELPFVPTTMNAVPAYLRSLVATYFP